MIIWGSRTARNAKGFVIRPCTCGGESVHLVVEAKTKFTLYFVPTVTTSRKAILVCTACERMSQHDGAAASVVLDEAVSREVMIERLEALERPRRQPLGIPGIEPGTSVDLAIAFLIMMSTVALADGRVEQRELSAGVRSLSTMAAATASARVREAASLARDKYDALMAWIQSPDTGPLAVMLATAGASARSMADADRSRYFGQLAWLGQEVAAAGSEDPAAPAPEAMDRIDEAFLKMGVSPREAAAALAFCDRFGG